jgi:hypothetical protein
MMLLICKCRNAAWNSKAKDLGRRVQETLQKVVISESQKLFDQHYLGLQSHFLNEFCKKSEDRSLQVSLGVATTGLAVAIAVIPGLQLQPAHAITPEQLLFLEVTPCY